MNRAVAEVVSRFYEAEHRRHGVDIELGAGITAIQGDSQGRVRAVLGADGREWRADVVVVGVGVLPNDELARDAGLECANGILVDEFCRTADPAIYAIGDCSNHPSLHYGRRIRLESVDNAVEQANTVAANLTGTVTRHDRVPWFWSDQYHHKMLIVGLSQDHDRQVLRGSPADAAFSVCYLRDGEVLSDDTLESLRSFDAILLGAVGTPGVPPGVIERGLLLKLRFSLDLYINQRPFAGTAPGQTKPHDFVVIRENTEGPYVGEGGVLRKGTAHEVATQGSVNTRHGVERCIRYAFELASKRPRNHVTLVHKTNVLT
ncbi:MAG: hypothetical protein EBR15_10500, partial [Gammaproteobacteria bacterium]|nr:hypothetical protein [Gammaproteobacteria bacterium]